MTIRITDTILNKPLYAGGLSDGTENVTRQFGNSTEQQSGMPDVPRGWGGVANQAAGIEQEAAAKAIQSVASSVNGGIEYFNALKKADQIGTVNSELLNITLDTEEIKKRLKANPTLANAGADAQMMAFEMERDIMLAERQAKMPELMPDVRKQFDEKVKAIQLTGSLNYRQQVVEPGVVAARQLKDTDDIKRVIGIAMVALTPESIATAKQEIDTRTTSDDANAVYGANAAAEMRIKSLSALQKSVEAAYLATSSESFTDLPEKLGITSSIQSGEVNKGAIKDSIEDWVGKLDNMMIAGGVDDGQRVLIRAKATDAAQAAVNQRIATHNQTINAFEIKRKEAADGSVTQVGNELLELGLKGQLTPSHSHKRMTETLTELGIDPVDAMSHKLTDPFQIKVYDKLLSQTLQAQSAQTTYENQRRQHALELENLALRRQASIRPTTQKESDLVFTGFANQNGLSSKSVLEYSPPELDKLLAHLKNYGPTELPKQMKGDIEWAVKSGNVNNTIRAAVVYDLLQKNMPVLAAEVDSFSAQVMHRFATRGPKDDPAVALREATDSVTKKMSKSKEELDAVDLVVRQTKDKWEKNRTHPLATELGADEVKPDVMAVFDREYADNIRDGFSPDQAKERALAKVKKRAGKTTLMNPSGRAEVQLDSPEVLFGVGEVEEPGTLAKMFGARPAAGVVTNEILRDDINEKLKQNGFSADQKFFLDKPQKLNGTPFYTVKVLDKYGIPQQALDKDGNMIRWTFDPQNNAAMRAQADKQRKFDDEAKANQLAKEAEIRKQRIEEAAKAAQKADAEAQRKAKFESVGSGVGLRIQPNNSVGQPLK